MTPAARFLAAFGRSLSAAALYQPGHPTLERAVGAAWEELQGLLATAPHATFTFIGDTILYGDLPLSDRHRFEWSERLAGAGVQRVQFDAPLAREDFEGFLGEVAARLTSPAGGSTVARHAEPSRIRFGAVGLRASGGAPEVSLRTATLRIGLETECETVTWIHREVTDRRPIPVIEVEAIVRSLSVAMHATPNMVLPLVALKEFDQYTTTHSLNVSVLAMGLAERLDLGAAQARAIGIAGLLHDIGKTVIPRDILEKPGRLTDAERAAMDRHPVEGARLILEADEGLDLAAIVAYEHHVMIDGGGYPPVGNRRECHHASRLVHVCDVFDALRTRRQYREAWSLEETARHLREGAGHAFDPLMVEPFLAMIGDCHAPADPEPGPPGSQGGAD